RQVEASSPALPPAHYLPALPHLLATRRPHYLPFGCRHRVMVPVQSWHEPLTYPASDGRCLDAFLVIVEPLLGCETGHADVVAGFAVALRIPQINDVYRMMILSGHGGYDGRTKACGTTAKSSNVQLLLQLPARGTATRRSTRELAASAERDRSDRAP